MSKVDNSLRSPPSLPEVAVTQQDSSNVATEINLSVEDEIRQLRERNRELEAENAIFREGFTRLYGATTRAYSARGRAEKRDVEKYAQKVESIQPEDRPGFLASMGEGMIETLSKPAPSTNTTPEGPDPLRYDLRDLNTRRRDAIVAYMEKTGKATITTQEARHVLQTSENRKLDRKSIWRALRATRDHLGASLDLLGGVLRLILPDRTRATSPPHLRAGGGSRPFATCSTSPRPRRGRVLWDGED